MTILNNFIITLSYQIINFKHFYAIAEKCLKYSSLTSPAPYAIH